MSDDCQCMSLCWIWHMNDAMKTTCNTLKQGLQTHTPPAILMQQKTFAKGMYLASFYRPWLQKIPNEARWPWHNAAQPPQAQGRLSWFLGRFLPAVFFLHWFRTCSRRPGVKQSAKTMLNRTYFKLFYLATSTKHPESGLRHNCLAGICRI